MSIIKLKKIKIEAYKPGKSKLSKLKNIIKLSANESALGTSPRVKKIINKNLVIAKYPDSQSKNLRKEISKKYKCKFDNIICGAGSDEIIQFICAVLLHVKDEVIVPQYSFLMYRIYAKIAGAKVIYAKEVNFKISIKEILKKVTKKTKIVFLANPNNPTGTCLNKKDLLTLRSRLRKNILLVIDDAYVEYVYRKDYKSGLDIFKNKKNVFILRTFSKLYGLASLRIGWGYGEKKIINAMNKIKPPFNVNTAAQLAATESLKDNKFVKKSVKHNFLWGNKLKKLFNKYGIKTNEVNTNFLLMNFDKCKYSANFVQKKMENSGIILRAMKSYKIKNSLRLTIGNNIANKKVIKTINKMFK
tara:strand:- start:926 stop:2002 length:1077 start_codon:yes stop_codon:yes gene_type:complete